MSLVSSMSDLYIETNLDKIDCKTLILCGIKDNQNMENAKLLNENIKTVPLRQLVMRHMK